MKKFVLVNEEHDGAVFCLGIYDTYHEALGQAWTEILQWKPEYGSEGDSFEYTEPYVMDGEGGMCIAVHYKHACWTHLDKPMTDYYFILDYTVEESQE